MKLAMNFLLFAALAAVVAVIVFNIYDTLSNQSENMVNENADQG